MTKAARIVRIAGAMACAVPLLLAMPTVGSAQNRTVVYMGVGGLKLEAEKKAFIEPFEKETGIKVVAVSPVDFAKIQTMVRVGQPEVDVVQWNPEVTVSFCGSVVDELAQDIDQSAFNPSFVVSKCGIPGFNFVHVFFYNKKLFPAGGPQTWADFFDARKFPGKRAVWNSGTGTNYEQALLADGVAPKDLYPLDIDRSLRKWSSIQADLQYWSTPAQMVQLMQQGSVALISGWGPAATQAIINGATDYVPVMTAPIFLFNQWMIPKGAKNRAEAIEFIKYVSSAAAQTRHVTNYPEGATNKGVNPTAFANPTLEQNYPTKFATSPNAMSVNAAWRAENLKMMGDRWTAWATR